MGMALLTVMVGFIPSNQAKMHSGTDAFESALSESKNKNKKK